MSLPRWKRLENLAAQADSPEERQSLLNRALCAACSVSDPKACALLIGKGAQRNPTGIDEPLPLCSACMAPPSPDNLEAVRLLLPGADPDREDPYEGINALACCAVSGNAQALALILPLADPKIRCHNGNTALSLACWNGKLACAKALLPASDPDNLDSSGETPLMNAASRGHFAVAKLLLPACDPNLRSRHGCTALMFAALQGHEKIARLLAPHTDLSCADNHGNNVLHLCAQYGHASLALFFATSELACARNKDGLTPDETAACGFAAQTGATLAQFALMREEKAALASMPETKRGAAKRI